MPDTTSLKLISPDNGALVDPTAIPFSWEGNGVDSYVLQLAWDEHFENAITTITVGDRKALTLYDSLSVDQDTPVFWRIREGHKGNWSTSGQFVAASRNSLQSEHLTRNEAARQAARERLTEHLAKDERIPYPMSKDKKMHSDTSTAIYLGAIILTFIALLVLLLIFGQISYPAEATTV